MRVLKRRMPRQKPVERYSLADREFILDKFNVLYSDGSTIAEAAEKLGVSQSSIKRWRYGQSPIKRNILPTFAQSSSIEAAIVRLADDTDCDQLSFFEALFKLIAWLRWPTKPSDHPAAMMVCAVTYAHQQQAVETVDQLKYPIKELVLRHIRLDTLSRVCSDDLFSFPLFTLIENDGQPHTELDWIAMVIHFLLAYEPQSERARHAASLRKAYYATQNGVFAHRWPISLKTFKSEWSKLGAAAPFHYVERFHVSPELTLDPSSRYFSDSINDLLRNQTAIKRYLAQACWVIEKLSKQFDAQTLQVIRFPTFPPSLKPEPIEITPLPPQTAKLMARYRSE